MYDIAVDRSRCQGHGVCELIAPQLFEISQDGLARVHSTAERDHSLELARNAAASCPQRAIVVTLTSS